MYVLTAAAKRALFPFPSTTSTYTAPASRMDFTFDRFPLAAS